MSRHDSNRNWIIWLSFLISMVLQVIPWPAQIHMFRPSWLELAFIYWVMALPHRVGIGSGFALGLMTDLIFGSTFGIRALGLSLIACLVAFKFQLLRNRVLWQQAVVVVWLSLLMEMVAFFAEFFAKNSPFYPEILWGSLVNGILWPWMFLLMRKIRRQFSVQ